MNRPEPPADKVYRHRTRGMDVFSTGQIAKMCRVAPRTVSKWFDSGKLKGYRIPGPGTCDRRVQKDDLLEFLRLHNMPIPEMLEHTEPMLVALTQPGWGGYPVLSAFELGAKVSSLRYIPVVLLGTYDGIQTAAAVAAGVRKETGPWTKIALLAGEYTNVEEIPDKAFDMVFPHNTPVGEISTWANEEVYRGARTTNQIKKDEQEPVGSV